MRHLAAVLLLALVALVVSADQRAPELDPLFEELAGAADQGQAAVVEQRIWRLWLQSGDEELDARLGQGMAAMQAGDLDAAVRHFSVVVERSPTFAEGWNKRATAHYLRDDLSASVADIQRTLALEPRHFGAISGMGLIFLQRGDLLGALDAFERVLAIHPRSIAAQVHVRQIRERLRGRSA